MTPERVEPRLRGWMGLVQGGSRLLRFAAGLVAGVLLVPFLAVVGVVGMTATTTIGDWLGPEPPTRPWVEVLGRDVSAAGGVRVVLSDEHQVLRLDCREACDDLVEVGGPVRRLDVRNATGECIACRQREGSSWWKTRWKTWLVRGRPLGVEEAS